VRPAFGDEGERRRAARMRASNFFDAERLVT